MTRRFKLVSIALATVLFALPLAALSACATPMPAAPSMAMDGSEMAASMPPVSIQMGAWNASCCHVSPATASPISVVGPPQRGAISIVMLLGSEAPTVKPVAARMESVGSQPRDSGRSLQSVLCVFLI